MTQKLLSYLQKPTKMMGSEISLSQEKVLQAKLQRLPKDKQMLVHNEEKITLSLIPLVLHPEQRLHLLVKLVDVLDLYSLVIIFFDHLFYHNILLLFFRLKVTQQPYLQSLLFRKIYIVASLCHLSQPHS